MKLMRKILTFRLQRLRLQKLATIYYSQTSIDIISLKIWLEGEVIRVTATWIGKEIDFRRVESVSHPAQTLTLPSPRGLSQPIDILIMNCAARPSPRSRRERSRCRGCSRQLTSVIRVTDKVCRVCWDEVKTIRLREELIAYKRQD